jgi:ubiquinone/menaquinone biosynthesis C-methylase UbiE
MYNQLMPNNKLFDKLAPLYDKFIGVRDPEILINLLDLPTSGSLLDAGGGTGRVSLSLKDHVGQLIISDLSRSMINEAQTKGHDQLVQTSVTENPFPNDHFDRIIVIDALHHFPNQAETVKELVRLLKPGGILLIEEPDINRIAAKLVAIAEKLAMMGSHIHSPREIKAMIEANGIKARIVSDNSFSAYVIAEK